MKPVQMDTSCFFEARFYVYWKVHERASVCKRAPQMVAYFTERLRVRILLSLPLANLFEQDTKSIYGYIQCFRRGSLDKRTHNKIKRWGLRQYNKVQMQEAALGYIGCKPKDIRAAFSN